MKWTLSFFLSMLVLVFFSCKKSGAEKECDYTMSAIAGKYQLISSKYVVGDTETDAMDDLYDDCELDDINELKSDGTFVYTDAGVVCSPDGNGSGTWSVSGSTLIIDGQSSTLIESFNCQDLVVNFMFLGQMIRETYRKL